jgi:hypothetical protein
LPFTHRFLEIFLGLFQYSLIFWIDHRDFCHRMTEFQTDNFAVCHIIPLCVIAFFISNYNARPSIHTGITTMYQLLQNYNIFISSIYVLPHIPKNGPHQYVSITMQTSFSPCQVNNTVAAAVIYRMFNLKFDRILI